MRSLTLSSIVKRRFIHCVNQHGQTVAEVVNTINITPGELCRVITAQNLPQLPLETYYRIALWLRMPLANVLAMAGVRPRLSDLVQLGMTVHHYRYNSTQDQLRAASEAGISVAVFRRALHGYANFAPSLQTCDRLATWLAWTRLDSDDIALAAGMLVRYNPDGTRTIITRAAAAEIRSYPCACGRAGCMIPAHIPSGPRRIWRSDACRMWAKRRAERKTQLQLTNKKTRGIIQTTTPASLPHSPELVRFIMINERLVPVRF